MIALPSISPRIFYKQTYRGAFPDPRNIPSNGNTPKAQKARKIVSKSQTLSQLLSGFQIGFVNSEYTAHLR
jgi:hypothetical protein